MNQFNQKNRFNHNAVIVGMVIAILIAAVIVLSIKSAGKITGTIVASDLKGGKESISPPEIDFPDTKGGTFTGWAGEQYFTDAPDKVVVLFASATVSGLTMLYYHYEDRIVVGTPQMSIEGIELFKGKKHMVAYSFINGGEQKFYYDGELKASSEFRMPAGNDLTGMAVGTSNTIISEGFEKVEIS
ncbi:MAG TPA: hypothetical protein VJG49_03655 [Candidatus Nanoarchaeia archaeon]|nr:hypothetical protein [Candidatus Nanoarchaeia archaeon]